MLPPEAGGRWRCAESLGVRTDVAIADRGMRILSAPGASQRRPAHECARITDHDAGRSALPRLLAWILLVHHECPAATPHHDRARTRLQPSQRIPDLHNALLRFLSALVTTSLARSFPPGRAAPGYLRTGCCCRTLPQLWALHVVPFGRAGRPCSGLTRVSAARGRRPAARCCWPFLRHVRAVLDQPAGAIYDRLGSRLLAGSLGGVAFESAPVVRPGVPERNRGEGW